MKKGHESKNDGSKNDGHNQSAKVRKSRPLKSRTPAILETGEPVAMTQWHCDLQEAILDVLIAAGGASVPKRIIYMAVRSSVKPAANYADVALNLKSLAFQERAAEAGLGRFKDNGSARLSPAHFAECLTHACELELAAEQSAAMMKALSSRIFHTAQAHGARKHELENLHQLEAEVEKLSEDLTRRASNAVADRLSDHADAESRITYYPTP